MTSPRTKKGVAVERDASPSIQRKIRPGQLTNESHE